MTVERLQAAHDLATFSCGNDELDTLFTIRYLARPVAYRQNVPMTPKRKPRRGPKTASELMAELEADPVYLQRIAERDAAHQDRVAENAHEFALVRRAFGSRRTTGSCPRSRHSSRTRTSRFRR